MRYASVHVRAGVSHDADDVAGDKVDNHVAGDVDNEVDNDVDSDRDNDRRVKNTRKTANFRGENLTRGTCCATITLRGGAVW